MDHGVAVPARHEALTAQQDGRRSHILDAARTCFSRAGFHRTSMQEICAEARMSPGGLYRHFASKDAIIEAIAQEERADSRRILEVLLEPGSLHDRLLRCGLSYIEAMRDRRAVQMMLEVYVESMRNTAVGAFFAACEAENRKLVLEVFDRAKATGELAADADVDTILMTLMAFADGVILRMGLNRGYDVERAEAILSRVVTAVLENEETKAASPLATGG